jgi:putative ABC transport system permease protein
VTVRVRELFARLRDRIHRDQLSAELEEELRHHRALLARDGPGDRTLGNVTYYREEARTMWSLGVLDDLLHDIRYAARVLRRERGFTLAAVLTIALGIGATTTVFGIVNAVLLRPLPFRDPGRLISVWTAPVATPSDRHPTSLPDLRDWQREATMLDGLAGYVFNRFDLTGPEGDAQARAILATGTLYDVLGATPILGRLPRVDEEGAPVVAISYRLWQERFGGNPAILGRQLIMTHQPYTIVGVMPPGLHFPTPDIDLFSTLYSIVASPSEGGQSPWLTSRSFHAYRVVARLAPHVTVRQAQSALNGIQHRLGEQFPQTDAGIDIHVQSIGEDMVRGVSRGLWTVFGAAALILVLACVNVAHLLLERTTARTREIAVRRALGAHRSRVLRQLVTESVLLGALGGTAGLILAVVGIWALPRFAPADIPRLETVSIDVPTLAFAVAASLLASLLFGMAPALFGWSGDVQTTLRSQGRGAGGGAQGGRTRALLTALEVAFAVVILVGAGLMLRSFRQLTTSDLGVDPTDVMVAQLTVVGPRYVANEAKTQTVERVLANIRAIPGVTMVGASTSLPPSRYQESESFSIVGEPIPQPGHEPTAIYIPMTSGFLEALHTPLLAGRMFDSRDGASSPPVVIISRTLARRYFPRTDPIGHQLQISGMPWTIVGVVGDAVYEGVGTPIEPVAYVPFAQSPFPGVWIAIRGRATPNELTAPLRDAFHRVDPELAARPPRPLEAMIAESVVRPRFHAWLLSTFGALALVLASIGIYGVVAYGVTQRRTELGIRVALGAPKHAVMATVLRGGMTPVLIGLAGGLAAAAIGSRIIAGLLYGVAPTDGLTFGAVAIVLVVAAFVAVLVPARRASRLDPLIAIRGE